MRGLLRLVCWTVLPMLAMAGNALSQSSWQVVTGPDGSFTIEMPGAPAYQTVPKQSAKGSPYTMHEYSFEQDGKAFLFRSTLNPKDIDLSDAYASHHTYIDAYAEELDGGKWVNVDWTKHQGHAAVEAIGTADNSDVRILSIIVGQSTFDLSYYGPLGTAKSDEVNRVFTSLQISEPNPKGPPVSTYTTGREPLNRASRP